MRRQPEEQLSDQPPRRRGKPDTGAFMPSRMPQTKHSRIGPDHRQMVRRIRPEPAVRTHHRNLTKERKQPDSLPRQLPQHLHPHRIVEPDPLPAGPDQHRPRTGRLNHRRRLQLRITATDRADIVRVIHLVPNAFRQRRSHQDHPAPRHGSRSAPPAAAPNAPAHGPHALSTAPHGITPASVSTAGHPATRVRSTDCAVTPARTSPPRARTAASKAVAAKHRLHLRVLRVIHASRHRARQQRLQLERLRRADHPSVDPRRHAASQRTSPTAQDRRVATTRPPLASHSTSATRSGSRASTARHSRARRDRQFQLRPRLLVGDQHVALTGSGRPAQPASPRSITITRPRPPTAPRHRRHRSSPHRPPPRPASTDPTHSPFTLMNDSERTTAARPGQWHPVSITRARPSALPPAARQVDRGESRSGEVRRVLQQQHRAHLPSSASYSCGPSARNAR